MYDMRQKMVKETDQEKAIDRYNSELEKCWKQEVKVTTQSGKEFKGTLLAYNPVHLNVVLMTPTQKMVIRNVSHITRKRMKEWNENGMDKRT